MAQPKNIEKGPLKSGQNCLFKNSSFDGFKFLTLIYCFIWVGGKVVT